LISHLSENFIGCFEGLPATVKDQARRNYRLWKSDTHHPSLHFKRVHSIEPVYSVRVGMGWRALGLVEEGEITWFWIGSHADYDKMLARMLSDN
jgi:hypothetical protein